MASSTPESASTSLIRSGGGGPGSGSGSSGPSLTPITTGVSTAATGTVFAVFVSCSMPEAFTGEGDFRKYQPKLTTRARLSGWQTASTDNREYCFALTLNGNALHFHTTFTVAQKQKSDQFVAAFRTPKYHQS